MRYWESSHLERQKVAWRLPGAGVRRVGSCLMGVEMEFYKMKRVLEVGYTTTWMYLTLPNHTLQYSEDGQFQAMCILPQWKSFKLKKEEEEEEDAAANLRSRKGEMAFARLDCLSLAEAWGVDTRDSIFFLDVYLLLKRRGWGGRRTGESLRI